MDWKWVLLLLHSLFPYSTFGSEIVVQVNTKKWIYYVPERFLSLSVDPLTLAAASPLTQESYNLAKGLSPSFVRIGGIGTNAMIFGKEFMVNSSTVSESQWDSVNDFARGTGLDIMASLNPSIQVQGVWDSQNSLELISYSNKKQYSVVWQLGYDVHGYNTSGAEIGRDLVRLAKILDGFPKYAGLPVFGPDISSIVGSKQIHFVKDLLMNAGNSLGSIILQPKFMNDNTPEDPYELITSMTNELDTYVWNKDTRVGRVVPKKPVWIAEPTASKGTFEEAKKLVTRLGIAAKLGIQIYLRQAGAMPLKTPTPEFWFSLLYKNLVGQGVLDNKIVSQNQSDLHVFSHCTASVPQDRSVLDTDWNYEKGAVTVFGVNQSPDAVKLQLKVTSKEEPLHIYALTSGMDNERAKSLTTMLNGQKLVLSPTWDLPVLSPKVKRPSKSTSVIIPGDSIFFIVMPDSKIRTCSVPPLTSPDLNLSELTKRLRLQPPKKAETLEDGEEIEPAEDPMNDGVYVTFVKKKRQDSESKNYNSRPDIIGKTLMQTIISKLAPKKIDIKTTNRPLTKEEMPVYITFNENSFLNKLAEGVKEELKEEDQQELDGESKNKYGPLTAAMKAVKSERKSLNQTNMSDESDVIKIEPIIDNSNVPIVEPDQETKISRMRRSSNEEPPPIPASLKGDEPMEIIRKITECKKMGTAMDGEVGDVVHSLEHVTVSVTNPSDESAVDDKSRTARHIGEATDETSDYGTAQSIDGDDEDIVKKTSALVKVVQETEKSENVSESPGEVMVPPGVPEKKLDAIMLETAKSKSEPEPNSDTSFKQETSGTGELGPSTEKGSEIVLQPSEFVISSVTEKSSGSSPSIGVVNAVASDSLQPNTLISTSSGRPNGPIVANGDSPKGYLQESQITSIQPSPEQQIIPIVTTIKNNHILKIPLPTPQQNTKPNIMFPIENNVPSVIPALPSTNLPTSFYNEQKETIINNILTKMVKEENKLAKVPLDPEKHGIVGDSDSRMVAVSIPGNDTILMAADDVKIINQDEEISTVKTLVNSNLPIELANEEDKPKVKVSRQAEAQNPVKIAVTPLSPTATLSAPLVQAVTTTPASPVSPLKLSVDSNNPAQINQIRETLKGASPEELRERFKSLREKMLELRSQYVAAREKRLEDIKKQVAARSPPPSSETEEAIKSKIRRREAELKEWFKRFDKRETQTNPMVVPLEDGLDVKTRPRRLSLFTDNEGFDMEHFFEEASSESINYKRSPEMGSQDKNQHLSMSSDDRPTLPKAIAMEKHIFPLDTKTHGIVYNNKIYPAKLFGYIDQFNLKNTQQKTMEPVNSVLKSDGKSYSQTDDSKTNMEIPKTKQRIAFVPRDAFRGETKSDFIPVIVVPPDEAEYTNIEDPSPARAKRSTIGRLEDQFHQLKEDLLPKISSWIKNLSEKSPWKRDLEVSSRTRRSIDDLIRTNDLRSLLNPKIPSGKSKDMRKQLIENFVVANIDKGEDELYTTAKKYGSIVEKIEDRVMKNDEINRHPNTQLKEYENEGYCEEIGTSKESIIRDPFDKSVQSTNNVGNEKNMTKVQDDNNTSALKMSEEKMKQKSDEGVVKLSSSSDTFVESIFASVIADKIKDFFNTIKTLTGFSPEDHSHI